MADARRPAVVGALPRSLYLETTNRCDSKCQTCIRTFETLEPPADLTLERVRAIVAQFPVLDRVVLHGIGEPLLNPQIFDIVAYLKTRVASVLFNSDAISLTPGRARAARRERARRVPRVDGRGHRRDLPPAPRCRPVRARDRQRHAAGRPSARRGRTTPRVSLWFTVSRANVEELPAFVQLATDLGVGEVYVQRLVFNGLGLATEAERATRPAERARGSAARRGGGARDAPRRFDASLRADQPPREPAGRRRRRASRGRAASARGRSPTSLPTATSCRAASRRGWPGTTRG